MGLQAHESRPENKVALAAGLSIMVWPGAPSLYVAFRGVTIEVAFRRRGRPHP
jgi:hypothetical protein